MNDFRELFFTAFGKKDKLVTPVEVHTLKKFRNSKFWPKHYIPGEPSVSIEEPYCSTAEKDWTDLSKQVVNAPDQAQEHIVRVSNVSVCMSTQNESQGYREERWKGAVLIKKDQHIQTGIVENPKDKLWYIVSGIIADQSDGFVILARYTGFEPEVKTVLTHLLNTGKSGENFVLDQDYRIDNSAGTVHLVKNNPTV